MIHPVSRLLLALCLAFPTAIFAQEALTARMDEVRVTAEAESDETIQGPYLPALQGTRIFSGKKSSIIDLDELPRITNNNYRQALAKTPGLFLSEETTPLVSIGYRGLDPSRVQYTQVLKGRHSDPRGSVRIPGSVLHAAARHGRSHRVSPRRRGAAVRAAARRRAQLHHAPAAPRSAVFVRDHEHLRQRQSFLELQLPRRHERPLRLLRLLQSPAGRRLPRGEQRLQSQRRSREARSRWRTRTAAGSSRWKVMRKSTASRAG